MSAQILSFAQAAQASRGRVAVARSVPADAAASTVVILPCVRYERWSDDDTKELAETASAQLLSAHH